MKLKSLSTLVLLSASLPAVSAQRPKTPLPRTLEGVVVDTTGGARWMGIVVESAGKRYVVATSNNPENHVKDPQVVGEVGTVGARVRVTYVGTEPWGSDMLALHATRVVRLGSHSQTLNSESPTRGSAPRNPASALSPRNGVYYVSVARCDAGQYSKKEWQQTANALQRGGIPAFFASHQALPLSNQVRGDWLLMRISQRYSTAHVDSLLLGPFSSKQAASTAVRKIPKLLLSEGQALVEDHPGDWTMGCLLMLGVRTN